MAHTRHIAIALSALVAIAGTAFAQDFSGLGMGLGTLPLVSKAKTRSICAENRTGEKGKGAMSEIGKGAASNAARDLGQGWKVNPYERLEAGKTMTLGEIEGPGAIQHIWMTLSGPKRYLIIRMYWDGEKEPSVECPSGDFFCAGWDRYAQVTSLPVCVNPGSAYNCYWEMPFRKKALITLENIGEEPQTIFWQIDYTLTEVPADAAYFHVRFNRTNPLEYKDVYTIVDRIKGRGQYVGTYLCWGVNNNGWWGEGEIKFFMDGDTTFPTICGTGTEDYFCGSYNFAVKDANGKDQYHEFSTPYSGMPQVIRPDGVYSANTRFGLYRWHIMDPVRFESDLKVTIQALGWRSGGRYLPMQDDISSAAFWYQTEPHAAFPKLPDKDYLEIQ